VGRYVIRGESREGSFALLVIALGEYSLVEALCSGLFASIVEPFELQFSK